jgi:hypothetical protein
MLPIYTPLYFRMEMNIIQFWFARSGPRSEYLLRVV